jgi:hypothetical protein
VANWVGFGWVSLGLRKPRVRFAATRIEQFGVNAVVVFVFPV